METLHQTLKIIEGAHQQPKLEDVRRAIKLIEEHMNIDKKELNDVQTLSFLLNKYGMELKAAHDIMTRRDYLTSSNSTALRKTAANHLNNSLDYLKRAKKLMNELVKTGFIKLE